MPTFGHVEAPFTYIMLHTVATVGILDQSQHPVGKKTYINCTQVNLHCFFAELYNKYLPSPFKPPTKYFMPSKQWTYLQVL